MQCPYLKLEGGIVLYYICKTATYPGDTIDREYVETYCKNCDINGCPMQYKKCPNCGAPAPVDMQYCRMCGYY